MLTINLSTRETPNDSAKCESVSEASAIQQNHRDRYGYGASSMKKGYGRVTDESGKAVAEVSYNSRVWPANHSRI